MLCCKAHVGTRAYHQGRYKQVHASTTKGGIRRYTRVPPGGVRRYTGVPPREVHAGTRLTTMGLRGTTEYHQGRYTQVLGCTIQGGSRRYAKIIGTKFVLHTRAGLLCII